MIHRGVVAPPALAEDCLALLSDAESVVNIVRLPGAASTAGDLLLADVLERPLTASVAIPAATIAQPPARSSNAASARSGTQDCA